jgi:PIN domain nuclease of toxin-antitoxin system
MIILDTCALIFDALTPQKLTPLATKAILAAEKKEQLFCCSISLWEIGMLIQKKRLDPGADTQTFLDLILQIRAIKVLPISTEIATLSSTDSIFKHFDPADRIIAATTLHYKAHLVTCDGHLCDISTLPIIW